MNRTKFRFQVIARLCIILLLTVAAARLGTLPGHSFYALIPAAALLMFIFIFVRFLEKSRRDLLEFLSSFHRGDFLTTGTSKLLPHSKDDLGQAYHTLLQSIEDYLDEKSARLNDMQNMIDQVPTGIICFNEQWEVVFINQGAKDLLFNPYLKNLEGIRRMNPALAANIRTLEAGKIHHLKTEIDSEPCEFLFYAAEFRTGGIPFRLITLRNLKKVFRRNTLQAWNGLIETLESVLRQDPQIINSGLKKMNDLNKMLNAKEVKYYISEIFEKACLKYEKKTKGECRIALSNRDLCSVGDPELMLQVLYYLMDNALEATEGKTDPRIELVAELDLGGKLQVLVKDNGHGITPEQIPWVFVPFFSTRKDHLGLGLTMAMNIMDTMNGTIDIRSAPGEGTELILKF